MIIARLQGGHSNQLFQYAAARKLAQLRGTHVLLDLTWFDDFADVDTPRFYELDCYPLAAKTTKLEGIKLVDPRQPITRADQTLRRLGLSKKIWMYYEPSMGFNSEMLQQPDNTMLVGFWQTEKYFRDIRDTLIQELEPTTPLTKKNARYLQQIQDSEAVSIHVRRGDYVSNKHAAAFHGLLSPEYYKRAFAHIQKKVGKAKQTNLHVFVFSNDIEWCKQNLKLNCPTTFIEGNTNGSDDMRLMKHCKHFIMANSSFSWWGSWLGTHPNKIVVAPKVWFQDKATNAQIEIALDTWVPL